MPLSPESRALHTLHVYETTSLTRFSSAEFTITGNEPSAIMAAAISG
ncbi:MAG: hypothetical protein HYX62_09215 [Gammaproteobacteria bacterium]|nr:hypothetical protein [Gammaproteobacteria bacterium]